MAIPKMTDDLEIIQALSDLPNSEDGLSAQDLKAKFDAAGLAIQKYINEKLIPALAAAHIPFNKTNEINAETIQLAIEDVQRQVKDAATGTIVNGSITKEKIASALLARTYGGLAWVSADTPGGADNPDADFPIGQVWLRPEFRVSNDAGNDWACSGCTAEVSGQDVTITGLSQVASVTAAQQLSGIGNEGDRVKILFQVSNADSEITSITAAVNGAAAQNVTGRQVLDGTLSVNGSLSVQFSVSWPSTSLADGSVTMASYTVVNLDKIMRQMTNAKEITDWDTYLWSKAPFVSFKSPEAVFLQSKSGVWNQIVFDVLPIERGGTGVSSMAPNRYLKTDMDGAAGFLTKDDVIADLGQLRMMTGTYTGTGAARSLELPVTPKLLHIHRNGGLDKNIFVNSSSEHTTPDMYPAVLSDGTQAMLVQYESFVGSNGNTSVGYWGAVVGLSGNVVTFSVLGGIQAVARADYMNCAGVTYTWVAIY